MLAGFSCSPVERSPPSELAARETRHGHLKMHWDLHSFVYHHRVLGYLISLSIFTTCGRSLGQPCSLLCVSSVQPLAGLVMFSTCGGRLQLNHNNFSRHLLRWAGIVRTDDCQLLLALG